MAEALNLLLTVKRLFTAYTLLTDVENLSNLCASCGIRLPRGNYKTQTHAYSYWSVAWHNFRCFYEVRIIYYLQSYYTHAFFYSSITLESTFGITWLFTKKSSSKWTWPELDHLVVKFWPCPCISQSLVRQTVCTVELKGQGSWPAMTKSFEACFTHSLGCVCV